MGDNDIIRWCIRLLDKPREASAATVFLESAERSPEDISKAFAVYE